MKTYNHDWLIAEWERMGRPDLEILYGTVNTLWIDYNEEMPLFNIDIQYRIKCKPSINWDHVSDDAAAIATDASGITYFYDEEPKQKISRWGGDSCLGNAEILKSLTRGTCDWKDSLVMRPVVVGE